MTVTDLLDSADEILVYDALELLNELDVTVFDCGEQVA